MGGTMKTFTTPSLLSLAVAALASTLVACGGTSSQDGSSRQSQGLEGRVTINGGLAGATIFVDLNDSASHDEEEPIAYTDSQGFFSYNPVTRTNYCRSNDPALTRHCLRLPSLSNLPDDVTVFYLGGVNQITGEPNERVYRYHVQVDALRGRDLDLNAARALVSAAADSEESLDIIYGLIDALYQARDTLPQGRSAMPLVAPDDNDAAAKLAALIAAGIIADPNLSQPLDSNMSRAQTAKIVSTLLDLDAHLADTPPPSSSFFAPSAVEWAAGLIAASHGSIPATGPGSVFSAKTDMTTEQLAVLIARALQMQPESPPDTNDIAGWAHAYVSAAFSVDFLPPIADYTTASTRNLLLQAAFFAYDQLPDTTSTNGTYATAQGFGSELLKDQALNDSFDEGDFDQGINLFAELLQSASASGEVIDLGAAARFLMDMGRDWNDLPQLLIDPSTFSTLLTALTDNVLVLGYDNPGDADGQAQLRLIPGTLPTQGRLQACIRYQENASLPGEQLFSTPLYVSGDWARSSNGAIILNMNVIPGSAYTGALSLDWSSLQGGSINFGLVRNLQRWSLALLEDVDYRWDQLDTDGAQTANALCGLFLQQD